MTPHRTDPVSVRALEPFFSAPERDDRSTHAHRLLIGALGLVLPALLWLIAGWRPTHAMPRWAPLDSVSAYYHTGAVAAFAGILTALAVYLFTYRGYANAYGRRDRIAAIVAGAAAVLVAFFPTRATGALPAPSWWTSWMGTVHYIAAVVLFGAFIYFCLFLFPKSQAGGAPLPPDKRRRNRIYRMCGVAMVACIAWAGGARAGDAPIFWPEALALEFFAISWLVKGRGDRTAVAVGQRALYYGREAVGRVRSRARSGS